MSVLVLADADPRQVAELASALAREDVLIVQGWRITRALDGAHFWLERHGVIKSVPIDASDRIAVAMRPRLPAHTVRLALLAYAARCHAITPKDRRLLTQRGYLSSKGHITDEGRACLAVLQGDHP